jgi:hypothetical protein
MADRHESGLGVVRRRYGGKVPRRMKIVSALGLIVLLPCAIAITVLAVVDPPPATPDGAAGIFMMVAFYVLALLPVTLVLVHRKRRAELYEHGLVLIDGARSRAVRWDEVTTIRVEVMSFRVNGIPTGTNCRCVLVPSTGEKLVFNHWLDGALELVELVEDAVAQHQLPRARRVIDGGGTVEFGPWMLGLVGIAKGSGEPLPWTEVDRVDVNGGFVIVRKRGKRLPWASRRYARLPNARTLLSLAHSLLARRPGAAF